MKTKVLFLLSLVISGGLYSQNVGIGIATPTQKLHVSDGTSPNTATIRVSGLSSTTALAAGTAPFSVVIVDANGVMYRGGTTGAGGRDAWYTVGNAGTTAGTNFIGTLDAQAFVIKTNGSAPTNERMRVLATGEGVYNSTTPFTGDVFSVYGTGYTGAINALGASSINGYVGANGIGVYGESNSATTNIGYGVWGNLVGTQTPAGSVSIGVLGSNNTAPQGTNGNAFGLYGEATGAAGSALTIGTFGRATSTAGSTYGVYGLTLSNSTGIGTIGVASPTGVGAGQAAYGVYGLCSVVPTGTGFVMGVRGVASGASGTTYGVYGNVASATGFGLRGFNSNTSGTGAIFSGNNVGGNYLINGSGAASTGNQVGLYALGSSAAQGIGVIGVGNNATGSIYTPAIGAGVVGVGQYYGIMGFATTTVNTNGSGSFASNGTGASAGGYFEVQTPSTPSPIINTWAYVAVRDNTNILRKIIGPGTVNTIIPDMNGKLVTMSCPEAPENLFQDYGTGQLVNGRAHVTLDPIFAKNIAVNQEHPLRVFIQLEGDCKGVYVTNKDKNGFDVVELNGGTSNVPFTWTVVANRADEVNPDGTIARYSAERFVPAPVSIPKTLQQAKEVQPALDLEIKIPNEPSRNKQEFLKNNNN